jgi:hypothetical protein
LKIDIWVTKDDRQKEQEDSSLNDISIVAYIIVKAKLAAMLVVEAEEKLT